MGIKQTFDAAKPYLKGAVVGAVAITIMGFATGFVVQTSTMNENVHAAKVAALAQVCETNALAYWNEQGRSTGDLKGWRNERRTELATQFAPLTVDGSPLRDEVVNRCDRMLRSA